MTDLTTPDPHRAAALIAQLQDRLLALGQDDGSLPTAEIEKTAKAINVLIASLEKADQFLAECGETARLGDRLTGPSRQTLLRKIKRMVENGVLDELDE
jgi:hypothetical protein